MADHRFVPTTFHNTLGPHDPVLTIESGDRVLAPSGDLSLLSGACFARTFVVDGV